MFNHREIILVHYADNCQHELLVWMAFKCENGKDQFCILSIWYEGLFLILFLESVFQVTVAYHDYLSQVVSYIKYIRMTALEWKAARHYGLVIITFRDRIG